jgi:hypothetical protein
MTIDAWLNAAAADAERRNLQELKPILESLARATQTLRDADFNDDASGRSVTTRTPVEGARPADARR